ncbi:MAG: 8-oxo-dGTP diphosphatase [Selenomonas sp.]|uniref:NUDIX hydrolase n=1 Tax=Selenomonas sp. TaxID=2053611 RepID=UPI0025FB8F11|nr:8-oxo-dGTP diphosphatase [Selenomonas sp.]MCR5758394.1 8-oxo-dGTP diphosphatase [Selenomonas sp.]
MPKSNLTTLCYIEQDGKYLMMHRIKKQQDINKDKWVGVGGHFEADESPDECLLRETREETGLRLTHYRQRGIITFISDKWQTEYMFLYTADGYEGQLGSCNEGTLEWIDREKVCDLPIWEGDKIFFRLLAENHPHFSLKLRYVGDSLVEAVLDGKDLLQVGK